MDLEWNDEISQDATLFDWRTVVLTYKLHRQYTLTIRAKQRLQKFK